MKAIDHGFNCLKLFPAGLLGGCNTLKALSGPFPDTVFCPTGGINQNNYKDYLSMPNVSCVGGSWLAPAQLMREENWQAITRIAQALNH